MNRALLFVAIEFALIVALVAWAHLHCGGFSRHQVGEFINGAAAPPTFNPQERPE